MDRIWRKDGGQGQDRPGEAWQWLAGLGELLGEQANGLKLTLMAWATYIISVYKNERNKAVWGGRFSVFLGSGSDLGSQVSLEEHLPVPLLPPSHIPNTFHLPFGPCPLPLLHTTPHHTFPSTHSSLTFARYFHGDGLGSGASWARDFPACGEHGRHGWLGWGWPASAACLMSGRSQVSGAKTFFLFGRRMELPTFAVGLRPDCLFGSLPTTPITIGPAWVETPVPSLPHTCLDCALAFSLYKKEENKKKKQRRKLKC